MGLKTTKMSPLKRTALVLAAMGALVMSSGVALMSAASPALADSKSSDCGGGSNSGGGNSGNFKASDEGGGGGNNCGGDCGGGGNSGGGNSGDFKASDEGGGDSGNCGGDCGGGGNSGDFKASDEGGGDSGNCGGSDCGGSDNSGDFKAADEGGGNEGNCEDDTATASVTFTDPSCANQNAVDFNGTGSTGVTFSVQSGSVAAGQSVVIRATAPSNVEFADESKTMDFPHTFGDAVNLEGPPCVVSPPQTVVPVDPTFTDPTCDTAGSVTLPTAAVIPERKATGPVLETKDVDGVHYVVTGSLAAGGTVDVDASAIAPAVLADGATTHFSHTFTTPTGCTTVSPPPPTDVDGTAVTPTLVHAGLIGSIKAPDLRSEQGLALIVAGMVMLMGAGGLGLRTGKKNS